MVMAVVENAELTRGNTMDSVFGMNLEGGLRYLLKGAGKVFGGMTDLEGNIMN